MIFLNFQINCMLKKVILTLCLSIIYIQTKAQFPGSAGSAGTTAIHQDSSIFVNWAVHCSVSRGYKDIAVPDSGYASYGQDFNAVGKAGENGTVSLGDRGEAVLTFLYPILDGPGPDFAVFENAFNDGFLELAFVEVSSNGVDYHRFPAVSLTQTQTQMGPFEDSNNAQNLHNLAGKYRATYGTPFDLAEIPDNQNLNKQAITHIKIIDVVGSIKAPYASVDKNIHPINDPYPTNFESGGFDLDAVGVIYQNTANFIEINSLSEKYLLHPNPTAGVLDLKTEKTEIVSIKLYNSLGELVLSAETLPLDMQLLPAGKYLVALKKRDQKQYVQTIIKY